MDGGYGWPCPFVLVMAKTNRQRCTSEAPEQTISVLMEKFEHRFIPDSISMHVKLTLVMWIVQRLYDAVVPTKSFSFGGD